jgi:hypothetical protein
MKRAEFEVCQLQPAAAHERHAGESAPLEASGGSEHGREAKAALAGRAFFTRAGEQS